MLKIRLTRMAENDLEEIWYYTLSEWGEEQANQYAAFIEEGFHMIGKNPHIGQERSDVKKGYRALQVKKHLIFYRIGTGYLEVLGVPHIRMDTKRHFENTGSQP
ncbi:MAG: type II toxin-antitoxin system RelE/ParE family toxin [Methylococcales bacterium]